MSISKGIKVCQKYLNKSVAYHTDPLTGLRRDVIAKSTNSTLLEMDGLYSINFCIQKSSFLLLFSCLTHSFAQAITEFRCNQMYTLFWHCKVISIQEKLRKFADVYTYILRRPYVSYFPKCPFGSTDTVYMSIFFPIKHGCDGKMAS